MLEKKIECLVCNSNELNTYCIEIYNSKWELIYKNIIDNNYICVTFPYSGIYKVIIKSNNCNILPRTIVESIYVCNTKDITFKFYKCCLINKKSPVTLKLTDENYVGLPIMKGEIILWQNI